MKRLDLLAAQLKQDELATVKELAEQFDVSVRTITRDLQLLRERGLPIDADRGRGGGVRLDRHWGVGRLNLSYPEAVDLLISIAVAEQMESPIFLANLGSIRRQLVASFSSDKRFKIDRLKARILIGLTSSTFVQESSAAPKKAVIQSLHQSFVTQTCLTIRYRADNGRVSERVIEAHYLLLNYPVWYVLAKDHLRQASRTFRCDRILDASMTESRFQLLPKESFAQSLEGNESLK